MTDQEYFIAPPHRLRLNLPELWRYRELLYFFAWRDIKVKYKQTVLGFLWAILQPLALMTVFVLFFSRGLHLPTDDIPAPLFYFTGLLFWNLFSSGLHDAANSMVSNAEIIKKIYFPRLVIPLSSVLVAVFDFLMTLIPLMGLIVWHVIIHPNFYLSPAILGYWLLALVITLLTTFGLGCLLAALNVQYRDFRYIIPFLIQFLLFVTPVIYPVSALQAHPIAQFVAALNPMTAAMLLARGAFSPITAWNLITIGIISAICLFLLGIFVFRKMEAYFADLA